MVKTVAEMYVVMLRLKRWCWMEDFKDGLGELASNATKPLNSKPSFLSIT